VPQVIGIILGHGAHSHFAIRINGKCIQTAAAAP
jgi:hypothetical protein